MKKERIPSSTIRGLYLLYIERLYLPKKYQAIFNSPLACFGFSSFRYSVIGLKVGSVRLCSIFSLLVLYLIIDNVGALTLDYRVDFSVNLYNSIGLSLPYYQKGRVNFMKKELLTPSFDFSSSFEYLLGTVLSHDKEKMISPNHLRRVVLLYTLVRRLGYIPDSYEHDYKSLTSFLDVVEGKLHMHKRKGFVNWELMESNEVFNIFRSLFISKSGIFRDFSEVSEVSEGTDIYFELEHFHNCVLLLLILELELFIKRMDEELERTKVEMEMEKIMARKIILKNRRGKLLSMISPGVRSCLSKKRVRIQTSVFIGFDTEFKVRNDRFNELLAYSSASLSRTSLEISDFTVNYVITNSKCTDRSPLVSREMESLILIIRFIRGREDFKVPQLISNLREKGVSPKKMQGKLVFNRYNPRIDGIKTLFKDLRNAEYRLAEVLDTSIGVQEAGVLNDIDFFHDILILSDFNKRLFLMKRECYLIAHFNVADIASALDFEMFKPWLSVLRKSFVTFKAMRYKN